MLHNLTTERKPKIEPHCERNGVFAGIQIPRSVRNGTMASK